MFAETARSPSVSIPEDGSTENGSPHKRRQNSYDFVRFCAASAVLFSHHFALAGISEPPVPGYGEDFGKLAVEVFFCLSGFLIASSLKKSADWAEFASARVLRIFPNLAFALTIVSVGTLLWYDNWVHLRLHVEYVFRNLLMFFRGVSYEIPGVFSNAMSPTVNGPLWSLPIEMWLYVLLFVIFAGCGRKSNICILGMTILLSLVWGASPVVGIVQLRPFPLDSFQSSRLGTFFLAGAAVAMCWPRIRDQAVAAGAVGLAGTILVRNVMPFDTVLLPLSLALAVIGLGSSKVLAWFSKGGDGSYGMYIFGWPVQQFAHLWMESFWISLFLAFCITTGLGYATWHCFEKRAMSYRYTLANFMRKVVGLSLAPQGRPR